MPEIAAMSQVCKAFAHFPRLCVLNLNLSSFHLTSPVNKNEYAIPFFSAPGPFPRLRELALQLPRGVRDCDLSTFNSKRLPVLHKLTVLNPIQSGLLPGILAGLTKLKTLCLNCWLSIDDLSALPPELLELQVVNVGDMLPGFFSKALPSIPQLQRLELVNCSLHADDLKALGPSRLPSLEKLIISLGSALRGALADFLPGMPCIRHLSLSGCGLDDRDLKALGEPGRLDGLTHLDLDWNMLIAGSLSVSLPTLPFLESLSLEGLQYTLTQDDFEAITRERLPALKRLTLLHPRKYHEFGSLSNTLSKGLNSDTVPDAVADLQRRIPQLEIIPWSDIIRKQSI